MKAELELIRVGPVYYKSSNNPKISIGTVDRLSYNHRIALKDEYHKKRMDMLAYTPLKANYLETVANFSIISAKENHCIQENVFFQWSSSSYAIAMNTNSAFCGSYTENPFWYQQFDTRQFRRLKEGQLIFGFDAADICRLYVTTMEAMNFQDAISSILFDNSKDHFVLVFDLTSLQDATENCHYRELVGETLRLQLNFTFSLEHFAELIVLGERMSLVAVHIFGVVEKTI